MKKIAFVLAMLIALTGCLLALASCGDEPATSSEEAPAASSEEPASSSSEVSFSINPSEPEASSEEEPAASSEEEPATSEESGEPAPIEGASTDVSNLSGTNLAKGCKYTGADIMDCCGKYTASLTDGVVPEKLEYESTWYGYWYNAKDAAVETKTNAPEGVGTIVLDLGAVKDVKAVRLLTMLGNTSGITAPSAISFEVSEDGTNYTSLGMQSFLPGEGSTIGWVGYQLAEAVKAQYVRVCVYVEGTCWTFISELEVY